MNPVISNNFALTALKQGEDAFVCDLTNQMDAVPVDANGKVTSKTDVSTTARIIKGAGIIPSGITPTPAASMVIAGVTPTVNIADGEVTYTWSFAKGTTVSDARYVKEITLTYNGHSYSADFTLVTDKSGATYNLLPSLSEIPFVRDDSNVLIPSSMYVYCGYVKNQDGTVTTVNGKGNNQHTNIDSRYYIYYRIKNADGTYGSYTQMTKSGIQVKNSDTYAAIEFVMSSATTVGGISDANIIDIEDVLVVRQNERGYGIVCSVQRNGWTEAQWNTNPGYGVIGHSDTFTDTSSIRNGARKGDLFTVVGSATDTHNGHTATYRCTNASGDLSGVCIAHQIAKAGDQTATVQLFRRSATALTASDKPTGTLTYTFSTGKLTGDGFNSWSQTVPANDGNPLYIIVATAYSSSNTDTIAANEWSSPVLYNKDGMHIAPVYLYKRGATAPDKPTVELTYTFSTGALTGSGTNPLAGWSKNIPSTDGHPCWVIQATAVGTGTTDKIAASEWSEQRKLVEDGNGVNTVTRYRMFTMTFAAPSANDSGWKSEGTYDVSGLSKTNRYLWQKKVTTYTQTSIVDNEISLIAQFDDGVQPNLLEDTAFNSDGELDAWTVRNQLSPSGTPDYTPGVKNGSNAKDGVNSYYDRTAYGSSTIQYKEVLQQDIWNYSGVRKIDYSDWYTFSFWAKGTSATLLNTYIYPYCVDPNQGLYINGIRITGEYSNSDFSVTGVLSDCCVSWKLSSSWKKFTVTFRTRSSFYNSGYSTQKVLFRLLPAGTSDNYCYICMPKLERNTMATAWLEHTNDRMADDIQHVYVGNWVSGTTYYYGGGTGVRHVVRAKESASGTMTYWRMKQRTTSAGYTSTTQPYNDTNHWEKANYLKFVATDLLLAEEVITDKLTVSKIRSANDTFVVDADGNVTATSGTFNNIKSDKGTFTNVAINSGKIGGFDISNGRIGSVDATATGDGGSMSLTSTFFRVGDASGYAMLGNNVFPATLGGAFTAVGRIINKRTNSATSYGFDVANYGLYIEVSGGTKNYGIQSTAAIRGSAVYGDRVKELDLSSSSLTYNIDLSQYNVFIMKRSTSAEYGVNLPDEDSIKKQFGYNSLPADYSNRIFFGVRFTLICGIQYGAKKITINNVYNCNGNLVNIDMEQGDVLELLVTNYGGTFRYMQVNKQYD